MSKRYPSIDIALLKACYEDFSLSNKFCREDCNVNSPVFIGFLFDEKTETYRCGIDMQSSFYSILYERYQQFRGFTFSTTVEGRQYLRNCIDHQRNAYIFFDKNSQFELKDVRDLYTDN